MCHPQKQMAVVHATRHINLRNNVAAQHSVSMTIGPTNRVTLLSNGGSALPTRYRCIIVDDAGTMSIDIAEKHHVSWCHELPANRVLYGSARGSLARPNGHIIHASGHHERDIFLGDGIASLQVAPAGIIWVGYFDEGLFGNRGWLHPNGGVRFVALNDQGAVVYPTGSHIKADFPLPDDNCRVNVVHDNEVWYCYEHRQQYPVVTITPDRVHHVGTFTEQYQYIAVGTTYLLAVDMQAQPHRYLLYSRIPSDPWLPLHECTLRAADGSPLQGATYATRGSILWILAADWIYTVDIDTIPRA